jgi:hypothetical protein
MTDLAPGLPDLPQVQTDLFLVILGGRAPGCLVELHDVRFVAGQTIEACLPELRRQWFGTPESLHLDAFMVVKAIDGWSVSLVETPPEDRAEKLWFVNLGAYRRDTLAELHHVGLVVAGTAREAKDEALRRWLPDTLELHRDDLHAVDDCLALERLSPASDAPAGPAWYVRLDPHPAGFSQAQVPDWFGYRPF